MNRQAFKIIEILVRAFVILVLALTVCGSIGALWFVLNASRTIQQTVNTNNVRFINTLNDMSTERYDMKSEKQ